MHFLYVIFMPLGAQPAKPRCRVLRQTFDHYYQITPFHRVGLRLRIVGRQSKATTLQSLHIHHHATVFRMEQFHQFALTIDKDKHITITHIAAHLLMHYTAETIDTFAHTRCSGAQIVPYRIVSFRQNITLTHCV